MTIRRQQILQLLQGAPEGLTSVEVAAGLGAGSQDVGGRLSKLAAYGEVEKSKPLPPFGKTKWRLNQRRADLQAPRYRP